MIMTNSYVCGRIAEEKALSYLVGQGLKLLEQNYKTPQGEIDIIMRDQGVTVFVEVRARTNNNTMHPLETIDLRKRSRIIRASQAYLQKNKRTHRDICRFDVIVLIGAIESPEIEWIKNAFDA